jgi:hypothetical protein
MSNTTVSFVSQIFSDASGAPALVRSGDFTWSFDFIAGEVRYHRVGGPSRNAGVKKSIALAQHAYTSELRKRLGNGFDAWVAASVALYAEVEL